MTQGEKVFTFLIFVALVAVLILRMPQSESNSQIAHVGKPPEPKDEFKPFASTTHFDTGEGFSYLVYNAPPWFGKAPVGNILPMAGLRHDRNC